MGLWPFTYSCYTITPCVLIYFFIDTLRMQFLWVRLTESSHTWYDILSCEDDHSVTSFWFFFWGYGTCDDFFTIVYIVTHGHSSFEVECIVDITIRFDMVFGESYGILCMLKYYIVAQSFIMNIRPLYCLAKQFCNWWDCFYIICSEPYCLFHRLDLRMFLSFRFDNSCES